MKPVSDAASGKWSFYGTKRLFCRGSFSKTCLNTILSRAIQARINHSEILRKSTRWFMRSWKLSNHAHPQPFSELCSLAENGIEACPKKRVRRYWQSHLTQIAEELKWPSIHGRGCMHHNEQLGRILALVRQPYHQQHSVTVQQSTKSTALGYCTHKNSINMAYLVLVRLNFKLTT